MIDPELVQVWGPHPSSRLMPKVSLEDVVETIDRNQKGWIFLPIAILIPTDNREIETEPSRVKKTFQEVTIDLILP